MDPLVDDPEIAQQMARILYGKLQEARHQLSELQQVPAIPPEAVLLDSTALRDENENLRQELTSLRLQLQGALDEQDTKRIPSNANEECAQTSREALLQDSQEEQERTAEAEAIACRIEKYKAKYKKVKTDKIHLEKDLHEAQQRLKREQAELQEAQERISEFEVRLAELGTKSNVGSDGVAFIAGGVEDGLPSVKSGLTPFLERRPLDHIPRSIKKKFAHAKFIISSEDESTWNDSYHRGILLAPIATFDPQGRAGSGSWKIQQQPRIDVGDVGVEVICTKADAWYYCGTYNCVYSSLLSFKQASQISVSAALRAKEATTGPRSHIAPIVWQFMEKMFVDNPSIKSFGLQRTGFDTELDSVLRRNQLWHLSSGSEL